jgi:hypothetical protein
MAYHRRWMTARRPPWPLLLALVTLMSLAAHVGAHSLLFGSGGGAHAHHHAGPVTHWRACALVCGAVLATAVAAYLVESARRGRAAHPPVWLAALLPPLGFALAGGLGARSLLVGVVLQLPIAAAFLLAARALPSRAAALGQSLRSRRRAPLAPLTLSWPPPAVSPTPALALLTRSTSERGPPLLHRA